MTLAANQARERGDTAAEVERLCVAALQYVGASTVRSLDEYVSLLQALKRAEAEGARARADKLREAKRTPGSVHLGFVPSHELRAYASLLRELGRTVEGEAVMALAAAEDWAQGAHFFRLQLQHQGRDPRGAC